MQLAVLHLSLCFLLHASFFSVVMHLACVSGVCYSLKTGAVAILHLPYVHEFAFLHMILCVCFFMSFHPGVQASIQFVFNVK